MKVKTQDYLVLGLLVFTVLFGCMAVQYVIEHDARLKAESLNNSFRSTLEEYMRTRGHIDPAYNCKEKQ